MKSFNFIKMDMNRKWHFGLILKTNTTNRFKLKKKKLYYYYYRLKDLKCKINWTLFSVKKNQANNLTFDPQNPFKMNLKLVVTSNMTNPYISGRIVKVRTTGWCIHWCKKERKRLALAIRMGRGGVFIQSGPFRRTD